MYDVSIILNNLIRRNSSLLNKERDPLKKFIIKNQNSTLGIFDKAV